jgi:hypothetical protein
LSVITAEVDRSADIRAAVRVIRPLTGSSIAAIRRSIEGGAPVFERELFLNDFAEVADALRSIVTGLSEIGLPFILLEDGHEISVAVLNRILERSERYRL